MATILFFSRPGKALSLATPGRSLRSPDLRDARAG
jgi:hypothetical protein